MGFSVSFSAGDATAEGTAAAVHAHPGVGGFRGYKGYRITGGWFGTWLL